MYQAALCELKMEEVSRERSDRLDETQRKLDQFYENIDLMRQNQYVSSQEEEMGGERNTVCVLPSILKARRPNIPSVSRFL